MKNSDSYIGVWWEAQKPEKKIQGSLTFNNSSEATFFTIDSFDKKERIRFQNYSLIIGLASNSLGKESLFFLYEVIQKNYTSGRLTKKIYRVSKCLVGRMGRKDPVEKFDTLYLSSNTWRNFITESGLKISDVDNTERIELQIQYLQPDPILLFKDDNFRIAIFFRSFQNFGIKDIGLYVEPSLTLKFNNDVDLKKLISYRTKLERLIMVLFERQHTFKRNYIESKDDCELNLIENRRELDNNGKIEIGYSDFKDNFSSYYVQWEKIYISFELPIKTFFFAYTDYKMDINSQFLNYVFALEQFHKKLFGEVKEERPIKNKPLYESALQKLEGDDKVKNWFVGLFRRKKNISFKSRLKALIDKIEFDGISPDNMGRIESTRHYLVHLDEKHRETALKGEEVYRINDKLVSLMFKLLKKELEK